MQRTKPKTSFRFIKVGDKEALSQDSSIPKNDKCEVSIVMPCLNEAETIQICIWKAQVFLRENGINGEVIVADNGSTDNSVELALKAGATVVHSNVKGYGAALICGINAASGKFIVMGDSDDSYDFLNIMPFIEKLREGFEMVVGNRFHSPIEKDAMPFLHKYLGNPVLSFIGRWFYRSNIGDFHCGLRAFTKESFERMDLRTTGMEFASEMIVKASMLNLNIAEIPTRLLPDGRSGKSHLNTWNDGWRHLRFLLLFSPRWLFLYPGLMIMALGLAILAITLAVPSLKIDIHTSLFAVGGILIGFQTAVFGVFTKTFALHENLLPRKSKVETWLEDLTLESGLKIGAVLALLGLGVGIYLVFIWLNGTFFNLHIRITMRITILSFTLIVLGFQIIFSSFFYNYLKLQVR